MPKRRSFPNRYHVAALQPLVGATATLADLPSDVPPGRDAATTLSSDATQVGARTNLGTAALYSRSHLRALLADLDAFEAELNAAPHTQARTRAEGVAEPSLGEELTPPPRPDALPQASAPASRPTAPEAP